MSPRQFSRLVPILQHTKSSLPSSVRFSVTYSTRRVQTSTRVSFQFDKMASTSGERVLVYLENQQSGSFTKAHFTECIVDFIDKQNKEGVCLGLVELRDGKLHISSADKDNKDTVKIKHPPFCPIHHMTDENKSSLPPDIYSRGIDCGAAVILESGDGQIFLTRRGDHLRTFPGIWVPPGGHIEQNETLLEAGLRELKEETGLHITPDMCHLDTVHVLAVWESVFPPKLTLGQSKRHHAVVYLHAKLKSKYTVHSLNSEVKIDPGEVGACAWFDRSKVKAIVSAREETAQQKDFEKVCDTFSAIVLDDDNKQKEQQLPFEDLLKTSGDTKDQKGRVSTGTKFALEEWLAV
ncbi:nucleoside diphosphate-linked moiety X motif 17-like [Mercenaria mercenaria]|uniref:nucleoside diphosphate-linked moiety X motif 17-like n=1 Tax=Mercenaria mercenaria TaxID=6596 RepID=UPI00234F479E|nr:nucleoside diphosphate-linked moiety X motif 17-like [Mercenaria mercenaria]XP_045216682.2 nucleoside diphosphate-linked moiety X motif 17-like [Mercenaria mercenaria]XP_045216683.2 nucleoside diphosphate-linked moiety X motif 17-like [Mercenaria mercenaria]XP_053405729.1 nucleoside diphosphate-linked moiety X motif 17-like [Mercenaria mercenaria]